MKQSVVIVGGGIGGLFSGALLAKNGYEVTVLEKNSIIGGGLQCFHRRGKIYETGMHVTGGFEPGGNLYKICNYLGIYDRLKIHHINPECMDEIRYSNGDVYKIGSGREGFVESLAAYFPEERENLKNYVDELYRLSEEVPLFSLKPAPEGILVHSDNFIKPADQLIADYISDPRLQEILAYMNPLYGGKLGHTPAYIHALINVLYINGASRFIGGSQQLATELARLIKENGGRVINNSEIVSMDVRDHHAYSVTTDKGEKYEGDYFISAIHPTELLKIVPPGSFLKAYTRRLNEIPNSYSAFSLFIDLKPDCLPYIDHTCYYMKDYGNMWIQNTIRGKEWPVGFMYMTPPDDNQGKYASRLLVHCIMDFEETERWRDTKVGHRGEDYEIWKQRKVDQIMVKLDEVFPGFKDMVNQVYASSPLTIRDYFHTKDGAIFGYRKDASDIMITQIPVYTKVRNLLLTGQNINLHGICGVPLTAINTAEGILGINYIVNKINEM